MSLIFGWDLKCHSTHPTECGGLHHCIREGQPNDHPTPINHNHKCQCGLKWSVNPKPGEDEEL